MVLSRRRFVQGLGAAAVLPLLRAQAEEVAGVPLGLQTYTFHNIRQGGIAAVDEMLIAMQALHIDLCELWSPQAEPFALPIAFWSPWRTTADHGTPVPATREEMIARRNDLRAWRTNTPSDYFVRLRLRFRSVRAHLFAYNYSFEPTMTDAEMEHGFLAARALEVKLITASSKLSVARRVVPFAQKHSIPVAFHNHSNQNDPDEAATPESLRAVLAMSPHFRINLDVAHFAAAGFDAVAFLEEQHDRITNLHLHDRMANDGRSVPMGQGIVPVAQVLRINRDRGWKIPCFYELEYVGADGRGVMEETRRELDYEISALRAR